MKVKLEIYKDAFLSSSCPWRAKVTCDDGTTFSTGMYRTQKRLIEQFDGHKVKVVRRKDLDCGAVRKK